MRLPTLEQDAWALESGEDRHAQHAESFEIPPARQRASLERGDAAKLLFNIESVCKHGGVDIACERMWVVITDVIAPYYIGRLTNQPVSAVLREDFYLEEDVEVPFLPEHIIEIDHPPESFLETLFVAAPRRFWPR